VKERTKASESKVIDLVSILQKSISQAGGKGGKSGSHKAKSTKPAKRRKAA
jgi:non-homologous end joining protein Ku